MDDWPVNEVPEEDLIRKRNTLLRIAFHIPDPDSLTDDEYAMRWGELVWASRSGFLPFKMT